MKLINSTSNFEINDIRNMVLTGRLNLGLTIYSKNLNRFGFNDAL